MMRRSLLFLICLILGAGLTNPAQAWGSHWLITDRALAHLDMAFTMEKVKVEPLEAFLAAEQDTVARTFDDYYNWMEEKGSHQFKRVRLDGPNQKAFLRAARLNPKMTFPMVNRVLPGDSLSGPRVAAESISPFNETKSPFSSDFEDVAGKEVSIRSVLVTFADEPDWWMDRHLWDIEEYGYGAQPYGKKEGESTKAPFHMQFLHENLIVRLFAPAATRGMLPDRVELFVRLARAAQKTGHHYWAYRFAAWAAHYYQDLTQPYHSKAVPHADAWYYLTFMVASATEKEAIKKNTTQLAANRHFAYEDFVSTVLYRYYRQRDTISSALCQNLSSGESSFQSVKKPFDLVKITASFGSAHAPRMDRAIVKAFGPRMTEDPSYDQEKDTSYDINKIIASMPAEDQARLVRETGRDFLMAGRATRTVVLMVR
ncbi:MAG: hypothetical protein HY042_10045 [Spirochaetia bacterium]|nr:hypothetical protein [Spirochaetia bacterium]